jgi:hypothetical protein
MSGRGQPFSNKDTNGSMSEYENETPPWARQIIRNADANQKSNDASFAALADSNAARDASFAALADSNAAHDASFARTMNENQRSIHASFAALARTMNENFTNLTRILNESHTFVKQAAFPLGTNGLDLVPECFEHSSQAPFTWASYPSKERSMILGSAHCAIPIHVLSLQDGNQWDDNLLFVEIPPSITEKTVERIHLLDPYNPEFANPLPVQYDLIAIEVQTKLDHRVAIPSYDPAFVQAGVVYQAYKECRVVGQSQNSYMNSKGGFLTLNTNEDGTGTMTFVLDVGAPGQSGTLLYAQNTAAGTEFKPVAIFHSLAPKTNQYANPQAVAAILPPFERLTSLPVCDVFDGIDNSSSLTLHLSDNGTCSVTSAALTHGFAAVKLTDSSSSTKYGVFVRTEQNIPYAGYKDWALKAGSGTPAPLLQHR